MKAFRLPLFAAACLVAGAAGHWLGYRLFASDAAMFLVLGGVLMGYALLRSTYHRAGTEWPPGCSTARPLHLTWLDYLKVPVQWFDAFKRTYAVEPGLYYTGSHYDQEAPLLVTANYHLSVFLVVRRIRAVNARLLVIDTDGINVWCAAGKGRFSNARIHEQLDRYERSSLTNSKRLTLILPKVGFAGIDLRALREEGIRPVIGPVLAKDLPGYLARVPYKDCVADRVRFGLQSRVFTWLPGLIQFIGYSMALLVALRVAAQIWGVPAPWGLVGLTALLATAYPILFPAIPGARFAVKGLWLAGMLSLGLLALSFGGLLSWPGLFTAVPFVFATAVFFGLSYTGNSAVSNYTSVRQEIAQFLPLNVVLYVTSLILLVVRGGQQ